MLPWPVMKQFSDPVYRYIEVEPYALHIINTPEFERLRNLRQLGTVSFVYSAADQTRFEHSLGVYYLTKMSLEHLNNELSEEERLTEHILKVVKIAALIHDIGHSAFSHLFDEVLEENKAYLSFEPISHEQQGCLIFRRMAEIFDFKHEIELDDQDINSVCSLIVGEVPNDKIFEKYYFLNEIVSNSVSGLDTDKMDYLARDSYTLGNGISIEPFRIIENEKVFKRNGQYFISNNYKTKDNIELIYSTRKYMEKQIYRHPKVLSFDLLVKNIFEIAIEEKVIDINKYYESEDLLLPDDHIINEIETTIPELQELLKELKSHQNYEVMFNYYFPSTTLLAAIPKEERINHFVKQLSDYSGLQRDKFFLQVFDMNYGIKYNDPIKFLLFHYKDYVYMPKEFEILYFSNALTPAQRKEFLVLKADPQFKEIQITVFCSKYLEPQEKEKLRKGIILFLEAYNVENEETSMLLQNDNDPLIQKIE